MSRLINAHLSERICGVHKEFLEHSFLSEILEDTIPVPFFGNYTDSSIATLSINPSSKEFYAQYKEGAKTLLRGDRKRLVNLSEDFGLHPDFFRLGNYIENSQITESIHESLLGYFSSSNSNWNQEWFRYPELALNLGLNASYLDSPSRRTAFHLDLSPWTTKAWAELDDSIQKNLLDENRAFLTEFIAECNLSYLLVLGTTTFQELEKLVKTIEGASIQNKSDNGDTREPFGPKFECKSLTIGSSKIVLYFISFSPSARKSTAKYSKRTNKVDLEYFFEQFGDFIAAQERKGS